MRFCHVCSLSSDVRPYGEDGKDICFDCATSTPERKAVMEQKLAEHLSTVKGDTLVFHLDKPPTDGTDEAGAAAIIILNRGT